MKTATLIILCHQLLFQFLFILKNVMLFKKLGKPIRGKNIEANLSVLFFISFVGWALYESRSVDLAEVPQAAVVLALLFMADSLAVGAWALISLKDSWRVGVLEEQKTELIETGIYSVSRNPYFVSYIILFISYALLIQSVTLWGGVVVGCGFVHWMITKEEAYLESVHGEEYRAYKKRVARYLLF